MSLEISRDVAGELTATEQVLFEATIALSERLDVSQTCDALLCVVERVFNARSTWILLHDARANELATVAFRGPGSDTFANVRIPCNRGIVGLAFRRRETVFVPDVRQEDRWFDPERVRRSELRSVFTVPLVTNSQAIGVVGLDSPRFTVDKPPGRSDTARL
jgi:putative methionine-R-sulfoxide reductase with GAF domain